MAEPEIESDGVIYQPETGQRAPFSVLWTTLPGISALVPVIGHVGITDSSGISFDFSGPYQVRLTINSILNSTIHEYDSLNSHIHQNKQVTVGSLMCGPAKRIWQLDPERIGNMERRGNLQRIGIDNNTKSVEEMYNRAVRQGACDYGKKMHNLVTNNCHHHVADVLNLLQYDGRTNWSQLRVFGCIWTRGRWVSSSACLSAFTPSIIISIVAIGLAFYLIFRSR